ncbi:biotin/lipoyl-containing protein [Amycolatopsis taiwanensis]|uniref:biotin/lipoyl-containing protein n=1 Tax=Amycolatopsis taiwanensis TaxID=342230 RepID=UPI0004ADBE33|nr:biotin/lipoyl-containing protein [Amycolatopsis taiwanensis]
MAQFVMPSLGADMEEGTILEWLVKPGDSVRKGDVVAVVDTTKAAVDVECFTGGTIGEILVPEGDKVPVGTPLAVINEPTTTAPSPAKPARAEKPRREKPPTKPPPASPPVRTFAAQHGIDLATVHGTGRDGAITRNDVARALAAKPRPAAAARRITPYARTVAAELGVDLSGVVADPVRARDVRAAAGAPRQRAERAEPRRREVRDDDAMRQAIATLMTRSKREIPHYYLSTTIDLHTASKWLREHNLQVPVAERVVPAALLLKASALAAKQVPQLNGRWIDGAFQPGNGIHLGVAISLRGGGLVPPPSQTPTH